MSFVFRTISASTKRSVARAPCHHSLRVQQRASPSASLTVRYLSTSPRLFLKEDDDKHRPGAAEDKEAKKQEHLRKQDEGKGEWDKELASGGEESVKADRQDMDHSEKGTEDLQHETAKTAEKDHEHGKASH